MKSVFLVVLIFVGGCVPYAIPPFTGNVGATHSTARAARTGVHVDVGFSPVQLTRSQLHRSWDATISGSFDREHDNVWGAAIAGGPILHPWGPLDDERTNRLLPQLVGRWTTDARSVGVRVGIERGAFATGVNDGPDGGAAYGELGIGLYAEAAYVRPHDEMESDHWIVTVGVLVRLPAMAGIACCASYR